jgi:hypothetical protein
VIGAATLVLLIVFGAIQLVPYGRSHANPPVLAEPAWDSPLTRPLAIRACFDCHSNETRWPWYSNIALLSWQVQNHVDEGRAALNFSTWGYGEHESEEAAETIADGPMPPRYYTFTHSPARLSVIEKRQLMEGLFQMFGGGAGRSERDREGSADR